MENLERRQCTAKSKTTGERCGRAPIPGGSVCVSHGGSIPVVQAAAKTRLIAMVEPVLGAFEEIVATWRGVRCEKCGKPTGDPGPVIQVGRLVLDRAGFGPSATMQVVAPSNPHADLTDDELIAHFERLLDSARASRAMKPVALPAAIDADVYTVPDEDVDGVPEAHAGVNPLGDQTSEEGK